MMEETGGTQTTTTTTTTTTSSTSGGGTVNVDYFRTIPGILKVVELVISIICIGCAATWAIARQPGNSFFLFVASICLICTFILLIFFLFRLNEKIGLPWPLVELIYGVAATLLYLIGSSVQAAFTYSVDAWIAAAVFGFFNAIVYGVGTYFSFQDWRGASQA